MLELPDAPIAGRAAGTRSEQASCLIGTRRPGPLPGHHDRIKKAPPLRYRSRAAGLGDGTAGARKTRVAEVSILGYRSYPPKRGPMEMSRAPVGGAALSGWGWGREGHRVGALLAEERLTPTVRQQIPPGPGHTFHGARRVSRFARRRLGVWPERRQPESYGCVCS